MARGVAEGGAGLRWEERRGCFFFVRHVSTAQTHSPRAMVWSRPLQIRDVQTQGNVHRVTAADGTIVDLYSRQTPRPDARLTLELRASDAVIEPDARTVYVGQGTTCRGQSRPVISCGGLLVCLPEAHADVPSNPWVVVRA